MVTALFTGQENNILRGAGKELSGDVVVLCPVCKALQTLTIVDDVILPTRKFTQVGNRIYHDCSTSEPCRLFRIR